MFNPASGLPYNLNLVLGGPGSGKTTRLLEILDAELSRGTPPDRIAFVSFTRKAVREAIDRATEKFKLVRDDFPYFRTIHSLCFRELGLSRSTVMSPKNFRELGELLGVEIKGDLSAGDDGPFTIPLGDRMVFLESYARAVRCPLATIYYLYGGDDMEWFRLKQFADALELYKRDLSLVDFTDMLTLFLSDCSAVPVDVAIIDESQDLNPLQWAVVAQAFANATTVHIAGDDDQSIYKWAGADIEQFLSIPATTREVLPKSYRLPRTVFEFAREIIERLDRRYPKSWSPRDADGSVQFAREFDFLDLSSGSWYLLARNSHFLSRFVRLAETQGVTYVHRGNQSVDPDDARAIVAYEKKIRAGKSISGADAVAVLDRIPGRSSDDIDPKRTYSPGELKLGDLGIWHKVLQGISLRKREFYISVLRRGENLLRPPRVVIDTIHAVKGGESDNVAMFTDLTRRTFAGYYADPADEHRTFYVGATRARENLFVLLPQTSKFYQV
jgi:superfamily I DNA/RNA helicase